MKKLLACLLTLALGQVSLQASEAPGLFQKITNTLSPYKRSARNTAIEEWWGVPATVNDLEDFVDRVRIEKSFLDEDALKRDLVNAKYESGQTKLHIIASRRGLALELAVLDYLVKLGADINARDRDDETIVDYLRRKGLTQGHPLYNALEKLGADVSSIKAQTDNAVGGSDSAQATPTGTPDGSPVATPRSLSDDSEGDLDDDLDSYLDSDSDGDSDGDSDDDLQPQAAEEKKSVFTTKNALVSLSVAGVVGIGYYFYTKSSKKSASAQNNKASQQR